MRDTIKIYTVSQINRYIKRLLENDIFLADFYVEAEISNFKYHSSGHFYFTLKDGSAAINAVMYRSNVEKIKFMPENGMKVLVRGYLSLYEKTGQYQLYARTMEQSGQGELYMQFEKLKERLSRSGVFDAKHKKTIPPMPKTVAVVTSPTGAAIRDIIRIAKRRNPQVRIAVFPSLVQGENSAPDIVRAIKDVNLWGEADVMIVGRGGGSIEDLWSFNDERVARAIFESKVPVISAVGHEVDFTIADFIADVRASTPSAAAELAVPEAEGLNRKLEVLYNRLEKNIADKLASLRIQYDAASSSYVFRNYIDNIMDKQIYVRNMYKRMNILFDSFLKQNRIILNAQAEKLESISPMNILKKGYSIVSKDNKTVKSINSVLEGDTVNIRLYDGELTASIMKQR